MYKAADGNLQLLPHQSGAFSFVLNNCRLCVFMDGGSLYEEIRSVLFSVSFFKRNPVLLNNQCFNVKM